MEEKVVIETKEINVAFHNQINIDSYLLGVVQLVKKFDGKTTSSNLIHALKVFIKGNSSNRLEKVYDKQKDISKLLKWCREGNTALYDQLFYIPKREDRLELMNFILDFLSINKSCFESMEYESNREEIVDILKGIADERN